ncbi:MAG: nucleoside 2-deoxyribosyltransferase [Patescibacteria group bacterium]
MKIYFAGSIRGGRDDMDLYFKLIQHLATYGQVLTEHLGDKNLTSVGEDITDELIYNRDMAWVKEADVIIAEVSTPSLGIGYEIGKAENIDKKILCLYREQADKRLSAMISGNSNIKVVRYNTLEEAINNVDDYFKLL